jgi:hypothetical protein
VFGTVTEFDPEVCDQCAIREKCTAAAAGSGRSVNIAADERLQQRLRKHIATPRGRARLRERVGVEHKLAHLVRRQGRRARYRGVRKNLFDLRRRLGHPEPGGHPAQGVVMRSLSTCSVF